MDEKEVKVIKKAILEGILTYMQDGNYAAIKDIYSESLGVELYLWTFAVEQIIEENLVMGIVNTPVLNGPKSYKIGPDARLTQNGLNFLSTLTTRGQIKEVIKKSKDTLKEIKDTIPGL